MTHPLAALLHSIDYLGAVRKWFGREYDRSTLFDHPRYSKKSRGEIRSSIEALGIPAVQKLALRFFAIGDSLTAEELSLLSFSTWSPSLETEGWLLSDERGVRLAELTVSPYLVAGNSLFLFADLPDSLRSDGRPARARLSATSLFLLRQLSKEKEAGTHHRGNAADFGSGVGIQALSLLLLHPELSLVWGIEKEEWLGRLSLFNAGLNGLISRFRWSAKLESSLRLQFVVSNPSSDIVPKFLEESFPDFGFGGGDGLQHTRKLLRDVLPRVTPGGRLQLFAQWAAKADGQLLLDDFIKSEFSGDGLKVTRTPISGRERLRYTFLDRKSYANALAGYVGATEVASIEKALEQEGVEKILPLVICLEKPA